MRQERNPSCIRRDLFGWKSSWQAMLLTASILNSFIRPTQNQTANFTEIPVLLEPLEPTEGESITLTPGGNSQTWTGCAWYREKTPKLKNLIFVVFDSEQHNKAAYTGRETLGPNCSLHIKDLKSADSGHYTVTKVIPGILPETGYAYIMVSALHSSLVPTNHFIVPLVTTLTLLVFIVIGALLYFFRCAHHKRRKTPSQITSATPVYENIFTSSKVISGNSSDNDNEYQVLQHGDQAIYNDLRG